MLFGLLLNFIDISAEILSTVLQLELARRAVDASERFGDLLEPFAENAKLKAEAAFDSSFTMMRSKDQQVFNRIKSLPTYSACDNNIDRGYRTGFNLGANVIKDNAFNISRYNIGSRESAVLGGLSAGIIASGERVVQARDFEESLTTSYLALRCRAISSSSSRGRLGGVSAFGNSAEFLVNQNQVLNTAAAGAITGLLSTTGLFARRAPNSETSESGVTRTFSDGSTTTTLSDRKLTVQDLSPSGI